MLSTGDAALVARDPAVPGLRVVLDADGLRERLRAIAPGQPPLQVEARYVRYKPGTSCVVGYRLRDGDAVVDAYAKAHRRGDRAKAEKVLERATRPGRAGLTAADLGDGVVTASLPDDRALPAVPLLARADRRGDLLARLLGSPGAASGDAVVRPLRYKPQRRFVAQVTTGDGQQAVVKCYTAADVSTAERGARAFSSDGVLRIAQHLGTARGAIALEWVDGTALPPPGRAASPAYGTVGAALVRLHAAPVTALDQRARGDEALAVRRAARLAGVLVPELADRCLRLADRVAGRLEDPPPAMTPVHGDLSRDQVLLVGDGAAVVDYDAAALGDPRSDLGSFAADLIAGDLIAAGPGTIGLQGDDRSADADGAMAALLDGYRAGGGAAGAGLALHTAAALVRLLVEPFRSRRPDWPVRTAQLLDRAEDVLR